MMIAVSTGSLYFLWLVKAVLYPFVVAFAVAYVLHPAVCVLTARGTPRVTAILMVYAALGGIIGLAAIFFTPILFRELNEFAARVPEFTQRAQRLVEELQLHYDSAILPAVLRPAVDEAIAEVEVGLQRFVRDIFNGLLTLATHVIGLLVAPVLAFYMLADWEAIGDKLKEVIPIAWRREFLLMTQEIDAVLSGVIRGQLTVGLLVMVLVSIGLHVIGLDFAVLIGIFAGLLDIVPYFGAVVGAIPALVLALLHSPGVALKVLLLFFAVHQLEGTVLSPKILGDSVGLHPLTVVFVLLVGGELYGLLGLLIAVPVAAILKVIVKHAMEWIVKGHW
jgi:predicted PurR-regulated permease PerM